MQFARVRVQLIAAFHEAAVQRGHVRRRGLAHALEAFLELLGHLPAREFGAVAVEAQVPEVRVVEAVEHHIQRRPLFRHEEHRLAARHEFRN
jgi:hypothetical protein